MFNHLARLELGLKEHAGNLAMVTVVSKSVLGIEHAVGEAVDRYSSVADIAIQMIRRA